MFSSVVGPPEHVHEATADHPHAVVHRHFEPHDHEGTEISHDEGRVIWLDDAGVQPATYDFPMAQAIFAPDCVAPRSSLPILLIWSDRLARRLPPFTTTRRVMRARSPRLVFTRRPGWLNEMRRWGTDIFAARQIVAEKLSLVSGALPPQVARPILVPTSSIMGEILFFAISSETEDPPDAAHGRGHGRAPAAAVPGVSQVTPIGGAERQLQVIAHPEQLRANHISLR